MAPFIRLHLGKCLFILIFSLVLPLSSFAETHSVNVGDFFFGPQNLIINEGDSVRWVWESEGHDVAEGQANTLDNLRAFLSGDSTSGAGFTFEVLFDRTLINAYPRSNNRYEYICRPHAGFMFGSVTVNRLAKPLRANLTSWQLDPDTNSEATGTLNITLSADEKSLSISGTHSVSTPTSIILRVGSAINGDGTAFCTISGTSPVNGNCTGLSQITADALYAGDAYVEIKSQQFPNGEVRGQIFRVSSETKTVTGRVKDEKDNPVVGAIVSDGTRSATTSITGLFTLNNVQNGVYEVSGSSEGNSLFPNQGTNPYLVNGLDIGNRNLTLFVETTPTATPTATSIPSDCQENSGKGVEILKPKEGEKIKTFSTKLSAKGLLDRVKKLEYKINSNSSVISEIKELNFEGREGLNSIVLYGLDENNQRVCGGIERLFSIESPLNLINFDKALALVNKAGSIKEIQKRTAKLTSAKKIYKSMLIGGNANIDVSYLTNRNIKKASTLINTCLLDPSDKKRISKLLKFLKKISASN